ncbi:polysaccharide pyruvyl transferase family protein [Acetivibrio clariflavus]|uniref:polysaccharide pyruvyl transferase family protein n=1 Tax=Acetivibrio clariflavus TaxID=288965 RepID=UPI0004855BCD|nr:polysaccharide pyruvyl transferase family protein [Acetivibrio clariflavus]
MKISIITLHYIQHYGSLLQTYATQKAFEKAGMEAEIIDYIRPNATEEAITKDALQKKGFEKNFIKKAAFLWAKKIENKKRREFSNDFISKYLHMTRRYKDYEDLKNNPPEADIYCTGSDQTWNSDYNGGILPAYFLEFAPAGKKRIGYAVSIGKDKLDPEEVEETARLVKKYDAISVREQSAKKIVEDLGFPEVQHILDPTLVLDKHDWEPLIAPRMVKEKYIIIYKLNDNPDLEAFAKKLSEKTGCKIVRMSYYLNHFKYQGKMIYSPSVEGFLSLINYAEYVITDSFHCLAFSLNFHKDFFVVYPKKYSTRLESLLTLTNTKDRVVKNGVCESKGIDYDYVDKVFGIERKKVFDFIEKCKAGLQ